MGGAMRPVSLFTVRAVHDDKSELKVPAQHQLSVQNVGGGKVQVLWVPESRSWMLSCEFVGEAVGPR
jgi:hypothetical protein